MGKYYRRIDLGALLRRTLVIALSYPLSTLGADLEAHPEFSRATVLGTVAISPLEEASGVVASRRNPGVLWTHNDQGDSSRIFAMDEQGNLLGTYTLPNAKQTDYEDLALGPGPVEGVEYLYIGDIGDNLADRKDPVVYRFPEPVVYLRQASDPVSFDIKGLKAIHIAYPDAPHDAEVLLVDPLSGDLFVITKPDGSARIFRAMRADLEAGEPITLSDEGELNFADPSGGDISPTGREILIRQEDYAALWLRGAGESIAVAFASTPIAIPIVGRPEEPNGEAIGFDRLGRGYFTLSDSSTEQPLYYFNRTSDHIRATPQALVNQGSTWAYLDTGEDLGEEWKNSRFDDSAWPRGQGLLGYGKGFEATRLSFGPDSEAKVVTTYFRKTFLWESGFDVFTLELRLVCNGGAEVYLNDTLIKRINLADDATSQTLAIEDRDYLSEAWMSFQIPPSLLLDGVNTLAVAVHLAQPDQARFTFDTQFIATPRTIAKISGIRLLPGGEREIQVDWGHTELTLQGSEDLFYWETLGTASITEERSVLVDPVPRGGHYYYRACLPK